MKAHYKTRNGRLVVEIEAETPKALFRGIAEVQALLESDSQCGACSSQAIQFRVRTHDKNEYFDLFCTDCGAALAFGQKREGGGLFPKRKDADGNPLPADGWKQWKQAPENGPAESHVTARPNSAASIAQRRPI